MSAKSSFDAEIAARVAAERTRLEREAGLRPQSHFHRPLERPFTAAERPATTILIGGLTPRHERLIQAVFEGSGYRCRILPNPDREAFQIGKENCNNALCNPTYFTAGSLIKFLKDRLAEGLTRTEVNDKYVFFTAGSCGPCRFGMYESEYRFALDNAGFRDFRVLLFQQSQGVWQAAEEPGLKYTVDFGMGILNALNLADVTGDLAYQIRPYEVNPGETDRIMGECLSALCDFLRDREHFEILESIPSWVSERLARKKRLKNTLNTLGKIRRHLHGQDYLDALCDCRDRLSRIRVDRTRVKPVVKVTGEFWAQTTESDGNYNMFAFLEKEGAQVAVEPLGGWVTYLLYQARARLAYRGDLDVPHPGPHWWEMRKLLANDLYLRKRRSLLDFSEKFYRRHYRRVGTLLGGLAHELVPHDELARLAHPYYNSLARGGEGHLEVAKNIYYTVNNLSHMVLSLKPFGCMPSSQSDGVQSTVMNRYREMIFLPIETSGEGEVHALNRVQMALGEAKLKARTEFQQALEATGKSLEDIKAYVAEHPELEDPFYPVPDQPGIVGVAANFVMHVAERMNGHRRRFGRKG